ncbi:14310_t:CDS:2 [Cetraspora pellucida]|uniref:14310_t:CDS:1 n=1 Tax=Cetraspora pellucida TaxID=1433469 RepID=A0ACA9KP25_9GLOM|nr:14310_t:CDS:2 [Cetraspora pellucida]
MFQNWDDVNSFFEAYGQQFGFAIIKKRVEHDNNIIRYRSLGCEFEGKYSPKKILILIPIIIKNQNVKNDTLNDIEFYTKNENLSITVQHQLLRARYSDTVFLDSDISNAIQHFKVKSRDLELDASQLLLFLTEKRFEESGWIVEFELDNDNRLIRLF